MRSAFINLYSWFNYSKYYIEKFSTVHITLK